MALALPALAAQRSPAIKAEFRRANPCPSTGKTTGACPGWQVDHIQPLCAGGSDAIDNLHWLGSELHKDKTRRDVAACRGRVFKGGN